MKTIGEIISELFIFSVTGLFLIAFWTIIWKKTILDHYRDKMFDTREKTKEYFERKNACGTKEYKALRDNINGQIRYIEHFSLMALIVMLIFTKINKKNATELREHNEKKLYSKDKEIRKFISDIRQEISLHIVNYLIFSSFWALPIALIFSFPFAILSMLKNGAKNLKNIFNVVSSSLDYKDVEICSRIHYPQAA